jgi:hypothetical protein
MTPKALCVFIAAITLTEPAQASPCAYRPDILATVTVQGCVAVTFGATDSKFAPGPEFLGAHAHTDTESWRMYRTGETLSGTLLTVSIKTSKFVWTDASDHHTYGARLWRKGESRTVFVQRAPTEVCPKVLPSALRIQTEPVSYDMYHYLVPGTIDTVEIDPDESSQ